MPLGQLLEASADGRSVRLFSSPQVFQSLLPEFLYVGEVPDVLGNRPLSLELTMRAVVIQSHEKGVQPRQDAAKSFDEVGEHPWRMTERKLPHCPWRTLGEGLGSGWFPWVVRCHIDCLFPDNQGYHERSRLAVHA